MNTNEGEWTVFYQGVRYGYGGLAALMLIIFSSEVWRDRRGIVRLFQKRSRRNSLLIYRILRISGFIASLLLLALSVDFYGIYGIYPMEVRVVLYSAIFFTFSFALGFGIYNEMVTSLVVFNRKFLQKKSKVVTASLVTAHFSINYVLYAVSSFVKHRTLFLVARAFQAYVFVAVIVVVNGFYFALWRHEGFMTKSGTHSSGKRSYAKLLKQWRTYAILLSLTLCCGLVAMGYDTFEHPGAMANDINYTTQSVDALPKPHAIAAPIVTICFFVLAAWRSWTVHKEPPVTIDSKDEGHRRRTSVSIRRMSVQYGQHRRVPASSAIEMNSLTPSCQDGLRIPNNGSRYSRSSYDSLSEDPSKRKNLLTTRMHSPSLSLSGRTVTLKEIARSAPLSPRVATNSYTMTPEPEPSRSRSRAGAVQETHNIAIPMPPSPQGESVGSDDYTFNVEYELSRAGSDINTPARTVLMPSSSREKHHRRNSTSHNKQTPVYESSLSRESIRGHAPSHDLTRSYAQKSPASPQSQAYVSGTVVRPEIIRAHADTNPFGGNHTTPLPHLDAPIRTLPRTPDDAVSPRDSATSRSSRNKRAGVSKNLTVPPRARNQPRRSDVQSQSLSHSKGGDHTHSFYKGQAPVNPEASSNSVSSSAPAVPNMSPSLSAGVNKHDVTAAGNVPWERERELNLNASLQLSNSSRVKTPSSNSVRSPEETHDHVKVGTSNTERFADHTRSPEYENSKTQSTASSTHPSSANMDNTNVSVVSPEHDTGSEASSSRTSSDAHARRSFPSASQHPRRFMMKAYPASPQQQQPTSHDSDHSRHRSHSRTRSRSRSPSPTPRHHSKSPTNAIGSSAMQGREPFGQQHRHSRPHASVNLPRKVQSNPVLARNPMPADAQRPKRASFVIRAVNAERSPPRHGISNSEYRRSANASNVGRSPRHSSRSPRHNRSPRHDNARARSGSGHQKSQSMAIPRTSFSSQSTHSYSNSDGAVSSSSNPTFSHLTVHPVLENEPLNSEAADKQLLTSPSSKPALGHERNCVFTKPPRPSPGAPRTRKLPQSQESLQNIQRTAH